MVKNKGGGQVGEEREGRGKLIRTTGMQTAV